MAIKTCTYAAATMTTTALCPLSYNIIPIPIPIPITIIIIILSFNTHTRSVCTYDVYIKIIIYIKDCNRRLWNIGIYYFPIVHYAFHFDFR